MEAQDGSKGRPYAYSVESAIEATGGAFSKVRIFQLIKDRKIESRKIGKRRVILAESLHRFIMESPTD